MLGVGQAKTRKNFKEVLGETESQSGEASSPSLPCRARSGLGQWGSSQMRRHLMGERRPPGQREGGAPPWACIPRPTN
ncbi:unnamed protein product [Gulo gulo]|uniref:Uncharacterized protein n=1 Tax=Gulo gulo TaxID=48420 RepID=A0A9X9Q0K3_GULGU|nr:unnamed protein product [Gulo gulo]